MGVLWCWLWCWLWCGCGLCRDSVPTFLRVLGWLGLCGGNCYHRRCLAACRRRVGGLWSQNPPSACSKCSRPRWNGGDMGFLGCSGRRFGRAGSWRGVFCAAACRVRRASVCAAGMIEPTVGVFCGAACRGSMVAKPPVVAWKGQGRVLFRWLCWLCSACLRLFVGVVWLVFVGGLGGIATIGAALRRVVGVSGVYGRKTPRVLGRKGQRRVPVEGSMVAKPPSACSKCSRPRWNGGDMGFLGCSGRRFGRAGSWRGVFCGAACRVRRVSVRAAGIIELTVGA